MSKTDNLLNRLGKNMEDSVGRRASVPGEPILQRDKDLAKYQGRWRSSAIGELELTRIIVDPDQPRKHFDEVALQELADSIHANGVLQPISVRWLEAKQKYIVVFGERRLRAARLVGLKTITCRFEEDDLPESTVRVRQLVENCVRDDLPATQFAQALKGLQQLTGWSTQQLAKQLGVSKSRVVKALSLLKLPAAVLDDVDAGRLSPSVAYSLTRIKGASPRQQVARDIVRRDLNREQAEELIAATLETASPVSEAQEPPTHSTSVVEEPETTVGTRRRFDTRYAVITIEHKKQDAGPADLQEALLAAVKQLGKERPNTK